MGLPLIALLLAQGAAFWPVWSWLAGRVGGDGEAATMAVALLAALLLPAPGGVASRERSLAMPTFLTLAYAAAFAHVPPLARALLALAALGATWTAGRGDEGAAPRWGLFLLAAPVVPTLQFYLGYPLRLAVAGLAAVWLRLAGLGVRVEGVGLRWHEQLVLVDAPCSGVRMLWGALFLALALAVRRRFGFGRTALLAAAALGVTVMANALRAASLFFTEAGLVEIPGAHDGVGILAFAAAGLAIARAARGLAGVAVS